MAKLCKARYKSQHIYFGVVRIKKFKADAYWEEQARKAGKRPDVAELTQRMMELVDEMSLIVEERVTADKLSPEKYDHQWFKLWTIAFENYLDSQLGTSGIT